MAEASRQRIAFLDWLRGFACIGMFETHGYDAWLNENARHGAVFGWSQLGGTLPAPLFLFASGISLALVFGRSLQKGIAPARIARKVMWRGTEIWLFGMLFRVQEFVLGRPYAPWTDLLRVDILNIIGIAIILMALVCWVAAPRGGELRDQRTNAGDAVPRARYSAVAIAAAAAIALATPPLWTTYRPTWLPWYFESYINGVHNLGEPQPWLFPIFPWVGFSFAGLAFGFLIFSAWAGAHQVRAFIVTALAGAGLAALGWWLDTRPAQLYAVYDFWHTSPSFFLIRTGVVLAIVFIAFAWCQWGWAARGFAPVIEMGKTSLFVYWLHIEFVYGRFSILPKRSVGILAATAGIVAISAAMVIVAMIRNRAKGRGLQALAFWRRAERVSA